MAVSVQQQVRHRKFLYLVLIFALFTLSLVHRENVIRPLARSYQLTEETRGEVELTSSALRLLLQGSRGLAVTYLWDEALEKQERHEWEELKLLVASITKLQPFFITPWLFQSWNLAFNVAVEWDRPRDKYYYVSQGLELLAEGERRNRGLGSDDLLEDTERLKFPGNPDLRHFMGQIYQLKFGTSDEKHIMRCLLEMSCIDPVHRNPDKLRAAAPGGTVTIAPREFERLCRDYPRLIRRLRDQLKHNQPKMVLDFLTENRDIPSRYQLPPGVLEPKQSLVKPWYRQFPLLPDPRERDRSWPDPEAQTEDQFFKNEWVDVFAVARTWYSYAQRPLPPAQVHPEEARSFDIRKYRLPKQMSSVIFRGTPARAQAYVAEALQAEGWFGGEGWLASAAFPKSAWPATALDENLEFRPGKADFRLMSSRAWEKAFDMYKEYGAKSGLYYSREELADLEREAVKFQQAAVKSGKSVQEVLESAANMRDPGFLAMAKLKWRDGHMGTTNFDSHLAVAEGESKPLAIAARRRFFEAERLRRTAAEPQALALYEEAWPLWLQMMLQYPLFGQAIQEDAYEWHLRHLRTMQSQQERMLKPLVMGLAQLVVFPHPDFERLLTEGDKARIIPIRTTRGLLDWMQFYQHPQPHQLKPALLEWTQATAAGHGAGWAPLLVHPGQINLQLTRQAWSGTRAPLGWLPIVDLASSESVRERLGLRRFTAADEPLHDLKRP